MPVGHQEFLRVYPYVAALCATSGKLAAAVSECSILCLTFPRRSNKAFVNNHMIDFRLDYRDLMGSPCNWEKTTVDISIGFY